MREEVNIIYLSNERFPARLACTIQQMAMCEAFAQTGASVKLLYPRYYDTPKVTAAEIQNFYNVEPIFNVSAIPSLLSLSKPLVDGRRRFTIPFVGGVSVLLSTWVLALKMLFSGALNKPTIIYSRNVNGAYVFFKLKRGAAGREPLKIVFEVHSLDQQSPRRFFYRLLRESDVLICISEALKKSLVQKFNVAPAKIFVAPDGVKKSLLTMPTTEKSRAREMLGLSADKIVLYTGQLLPGKGAEVFVEAARFFDNDVLFLLVGGHGDYLRRLQERVNEKGPSNVILTGFEPPAQIPLYQAAADVVVLPATADHDISAYTSPLKLFEYMASRRPIVASDLPVLKEILRDGENALFFSERNAEALAGKIKTLLQDKELAFRLADRAFRDVQTLSWEERAQRILEFIKGVERDYENEEK